MSIPRYAGFVTALNPPLKHARRKASCQRQILSLSIRHVNEQLYLTSPGDDAAYMVFGSIFLERFKPRDVLHVD